MLKVATLSVFILGTIGAALWDDVLVTERDLPEVVSQASNGAPGSPPEVVAEDQTEYCFGHPDTPTRLHCTRCDKAICGRCAVSASVGQHCVWCVAEAKKSAPKVRSTMQAGSPAVFAIIGINVAMYLLETFFPVVLQRFSEQPAAIANGEYWRLFTAMFLHAPLGARFGIFHILFNMYILRIYGPNVEEAFGKARFVGMYLIAGLGGGTLSYLLSNCAVSGVGASGAIFGVVGILLVYLYRRRTSSFVAAYQRSLMTFVGINLLFGFLVPGIDNYAHIGGLVAGMALGAGLDAGPAGNVSRGREVMTILGVLGIIGAVIIFRTATMPIGCIAFLQ